MTDTALWDVLAGNVVPQGKMPFALANNVEAVATQAPDLPGYDVADTLFPFGHGLTYADPFDTLSSSLTVWIASGEVAGPVALERFLALLGQPRKPDTLSPEAQEDLRTQAEHLLRRL